MKRSRTFRTFSFFQKIVALTLSGLIPLATLPEAALALPHGGVVSKGSATLGYSTGKLGIKQTTSSATFDWGSYNVKAGQSVVYSVPGSTSVSMNYIGGTTPSSIDGTVTSNGILEFMNPNGLIFGSGSVVSAAGVMAFGSSTPWGKPTGAVTNAGTLTATTGGTVALVGTAVTNSGTITAPGGEVLLAAGSTVTPIATTGVSSLSVATTGGGLVDDSGIVSAETVNGKTGTVILQAGMQTGGVALDASAVVDASAPNGGNGGQVFINASGVVLNDAEPINVSAPYGTKGTVRIDPNYTLWGTTLDICNATGLEYLDGNQSSYLSDKIVLESNMNLGGSYSWTPLGTSSTPFTGTFNGNGYVVSGYTITATSNFAGFISDLGSGGVVKNMGVAGTVNGGSHCTVGGIVGYNNGGTVEYSYNTGSVSGSSYVGGVVGSNNGGTVKYSYNTGNVSGSSYVGGIVGTNGGTVEYSYNTGSVSGVGDVGGVVGCNSGTVEYSYNTGTVSVSVSGSDVGGVVGCNSGTVETSYNTGSVSGSSYVGGVVGENSPVVGTVQDNYYNTSVPYGSGAIGGGTTSGTGISNNNGISQSDFAVTTSATAGVSNLGSFNTWNSSTGAFNTTNMTSAPWFEGSVVSGSGTITAPMLVPDLPTATVTENSGTSVYSGSTVTAGYTTTYTMGGTTLSPNVTVTTSVGPNAGTTTNTPTYSISAPTTQTSVDFVSAVSGTWTITKADLTATATSASMTYGGTVPTLSGTVTGFVNGQTLSTDSGTWSTSATSSSNVGSYGVSLALGSPYSGDYTITAASGNATALTIGKADLTVTANKATMTYGGTLPTLSGTITGFVNGQTFSEDGMIETWATTATSTSHIGTYGITGTVSVLVGLPYSGDYTVVQSPGNSTALTITAATSTTGEGSSGSSGTGSSGSSTAGGITSTNFPPVSQTVDLYQKLPSLSGSYSPGNFSNSGTPSGNSITLSSSGETSLTVIQPFGDDTSGDGILSAQELKP